MFVHLPIALVKDSLCSFFHAHSLKQQSSDSSASGSSSGLDAPLINDTYQILETDTATRSCAITGKDLSDREEGWPLIWKDDEGEPGLVKLNCELNSWEVAKNGLYLTPIWFMTEVIRAYHL